MGQPTFADLECQVQKRKTRREPFPERSDTAKCATGMLAKDTERLTPLSGLGNLLAAKGNWGVVPAATGPARTVVFAPPAASANTVQGKMGFVQNILR